MLFDLGATCSFLSKSRIEDLELGYFEHVSYTVVVPSGKLYHCNKIFENVLM